MNTNSAYSNYHPTDLNTVAVFGEIKKNILTDNFRGGASSNVFGSTKLDFSHAGLNGVAIVDITQLFGDIKIIVPHDWQIELDISNFFSTVNDRRIAKNTAGQKLLVLKGASVFGNVDLLSSTF